jgi:hypothetical protein
MTFNPISALSRATLAGICQYPLTRNLAAAMMTEAQTIANKLGITFRVPLEKRIAGAEKVGHHKTSMLQDVEARRALETDALLGAVVELGRLTQTSTPHLDTVYALTKLCWQRRWKRNSRMRRLVRRLKRCGSSVQASGSVRTLRCLAGIWGRASTLDRSSAVAAIAPSAQVSALTSSPARAALGLPKRPCRQRCSSRYVHGILLGKVYVAKPLDALAAGRPRFFSGVKHAPDRHRDAAPQWH